MNRFLPTLRDEKQEQTGWITSEYFNKSSLQTWTLLKTCSKTSPQSLVGTDSNWNANGSDSANQFWPAPAQTADPKRWIHHKMAVDDWKSNDKREKWIPDVVLSAVDSGLAGKARFGGVERRRALVAAQTLRVPILSDGDQVEMVANAQTTAPAHHHRRRRRRRCRRRPSLHSPRCHVGVRYARHRLFTCVQRRLTNRNWLKISLKITEVDERVSSSSSSISSSSAVASWASSSCSSSASFFNDVCSVLVATDGKLADIFDVLPSNAVECCSSAVDVAVRASASVGSPWNGCCWSFNQMLSFHSKIQIELVHSTSVVGWMDVNNRLLGLW